MSTPELVIVGAGPAGMAAAITLAQQGQGVTLVDQNPRPGGQIYRVPAVAAKSPPPADRGSHLRLLLEQFAGQITVLSDHEVLGVFDQRRLAVNGPDGFRMLEPDQLVLATGAYEYVPPFPGWTLPGVMTPGAAQQLVKSQGVLPGRRVLVAGSGPFLLVVALALHGAGVEVVGICDALRRRDVFWKLPGLWADGELRRLGISYLRQVRRAGIPLRTGRLVTRAEGTDRLEAVQIAPCDGDWFPDHGRARTLQIDTLCIGYGFVPRLGLAQLAGCELVCGDQPGGWVPRVDAWGETSVAGVWAAGDGAGVAGAVVAELAGELVGLGIAARIGALDPSAAESLATPLRRRLKRLGRFRRALDELGRPRPGLSALADEDTVICRCEELVRREIDTAVAAGSTTLRSLKVATRLGMGPCQGRMCQPAAARRLADTGTTTLAGAGTPSFRPPLVPVTLGELASDAGNVADVGTVG